MLFGLFGCGGFGREVMPIAREAIDRIHPGARAVFVETSPSKGKVVNGHAVVSVDEFLGADDQDRRFNIAVADSILREKIAQKFVAAGARPLTLISAQSTVYDPGALAEGAIVCAGGVITSNVTIGRYFHCNFQCYVAHDCVVGDFVTLAPHVTCCGAVVLGDHTYIGAGAVIRQSTPGRPMHVAADAFIGMGAVVTKSVPPGETWSGNPARRMERVLRSRQPATGRG